MSEPTKHYKRCLAEAQRHQQNSKTYSGKFLRPHAPFIKKIIEDLNITSILDYGAGKGQQYDWVMPSRGQTLEQFWGIEVKKYDPAWPPYAAEPVGTFDLVICTHTLGAIPKTDLGWVIDRLFSLSNKAIYVAEKIGVMKKKVFSQPELMPIGWSADEWRSAIARPTEKDVWLSTRERTKDGAIMEHSKLGADGVWKGYRWPEGMEAFSHKTA